MTAYPWDTFCVEVGRDPAGLEKLAASDAYAAGLGLTEIETTDIIRRVYSRPQAPPAPPWWHELKPADHVKARADGCPIYTATMALAGRRRAGTVMDVWPPGVNLDRAMICVYSGDEARYPGGLWVAPDDVEAA